MSYWYLGNAEDRAGASPDFVIPPRLVRESLVFGDTVKLLFLNDDPPAGERMWVTVVKRVSGPCYEGELRNEAVSMDIPYGTLVSFGPEHVCSVEESDTLTSVFEREAHGVGLIYGLPPSDES